VSDTLRQGREAEAWACDYLQRRGLKPLSKNFRCRYGEIDLIMQDGRTLVFVEVKYRGRDDYGGAAGAVTRGKQAKLVKTAMTYMQQEKPLLQNMRFDVVAMRPGIEEKFACEWLQNVIEQHQG
jgi:putative endonuclease